MSQYQTKDSGVRENFDSGMVRDTQAGKPRFDLTIPEGVPYAEQMFTRFAALMARGADKYGERNWEKANGPEELARAKSSALRHMMQYIMGENDEDHAAAVLFNIFEAETVRYKMRQSAAAPFVTVDRTMSDGPCVYCEQGIAHAHKNEPEFC